MESDSMDLKARELLKEVTLDYSPTLSKHVNDTVSAIKDAINKIPNDLNVTVDEAPGFVRDIGADQVEFKFKKPTSIEIGGTYTIQCIVKPDINFDLFIRLPKIPYWLTYDFPPEVREKLKHQWGSDWKGQAQKWFLLKFTGKDEEINLLGDGTEKAEFGEWSWMSPEQIVELVGRLYHSNAFIKISP